jgi:DNA repair exonuclease SbcCD nuclease subunit
MGKIRKVVHLSDIHVRTLEYHELYDKQFRKLIFVLREKFQGFEHEEIRIVITGDIAHQKIHISNEQMTLISTFLRELSKVGKVIIIPGNHDFLENNHDRMDTISPIINIMKNENIIFYKTGGVYQDDNVNWVVYSLYEFNKKPEHEHVNGLKIGLYHGQVEGMSTDLGFEFEDGFSRLNFLGLDIVLCGDIHKRQVQYQTLEIEVDEDQVDDYLKLGWEIKNKKYIMGKIKLVKRTPIIQIGSLIQQNFGETVKHHGYGIFDVKTKNYEFNDLDNDEPFLHFKIDSFDDIQKGNETHVNLG